MLYPEPLATQEEVFNDPALFRSTLQDCMQRLGMQQPRVPRFGGMELDLHLLYKEVTSLGGLELVNKRKQWVLACEPFNFPASYTNKAYVMKKLYTSALQHYEQVYYHRRSGPVPTVPAPGQVEGCGVKREAAACLHSPPDMQDMEEDREVLEARVVTADPLPFYTPGGPIAWQNQPLQGPAADNDDLNGNISSWVLLYKQSVDGREGAGVTAGPAAGEGREGQAWAGLNSWDGAASGAAEKERAAAAAPDPPAQAAAAREGCVSAAAAAAEQLLPASGQQQAGAAAEPCAAVRAMHRQQAIAAQLANLRDLVALKQHLTAAQYEEIRSDILARV